MAEQRCYAGVGSRRTPQEMLARLELAASALARGGWTLRTGLSPGADQACYRGALAGGGRVELYLPRPGFQARARLSGEGAEADAEVYVLPAPSDRAFALAARFHPRWKQLSAGARELRARDVHTVLGRDLASPVSLLVCWTRDGGLDGRGPRAGGTGQALRIAAAHHVEVLNVRRPEHARRVRALSSPPPPPRGS